MKNIFYFLMFSFLFFSGMKSSFAGQSVTIERIFLQPQPYRPAYGFYRSDFGRDFGLSRPPFFAKHYTRNNFLSGHPALPSYMASVQAIRFRKLSGAPVHAKTKTVPSATGKANKIVAGSKAKIYRVSAEKITVAPGKVRIIRGSATR